MEEAAAPLADFLPAAPEEEEEAAPSEAEPSEERAVADGPAAPQSEEEEEAAEEEDDQLVEDDRQQAAGEADSQLPATELPEKDASVAAPHSPARSASDECRDEAEGVGPLFSPVQHTPVDDREGASTAPTARALCQYFVLATPRTSFESPRRDLKCDAIDSNSRSRKKAPQSARSPPPVQLMPCQRQTTPKAKTRGTTPTTTASERRTHQLQMTPESRRGGSDIDDGDARSVASLSVYSDVCHQSRLTQLSRKTVSRKHLSTKEMEEMQLEEKRRALRDMIRRNEVNCRKALNATDIGSAGRTERSMKVTVPKEFNLSRSGLRTPRSARDEYAASDCESECSELSCRSTTSSRVTKPRTATPTKRWQPQLTVPKGPALSTDRRVSLGMRRTMSCPPEDDTGSSGSSNVFRKLTREVTPEMRRQAFVEAAQMQRHVAVSTAWAAGSPRSGASSARGAQSAHAGANANSGAARPPKTSKQVGGGSVQERAERARLQAQQRKDEEARAAKEKVGLFKKTATPARSARAQYGQQTDAAEDATADMLSVSSRISTRSTSSLNGAGGSKASLRPRRPSFGSAAERPCCSPR